LQVVFPIKLVRTKQGLIPATDAQAQGATLPSIAAGDRIVVGGLQRVRPGMTVDPRPMAQEMSAESGN
jgi:hypothetical protein